MNRTQRILFSVLIFCLIVVFAFVHPRSHTSLLSSAIVGGVTGQIKVSLKVPKACIATSVYFGHRTTSPRRQFWCIVVLVSVVQDVSLPSTSEFERYDPTQSIGSRRPPFDQWSLSVNRRPRSIPNLPLRLILNAGYLDSFCSLISTSMLTVSSDCARCARTVARPFKHWSNTNLSMLCVHGVCTASYVPVDGFAITQPLCLR